MSENIRTNNNSVISITVGILSLFIPIIGLILGVIGIIFSKKAVKQINTSNENGTGFAIAGLICSILGVIVQLFMILGMVAYFSITNTYM